MKNNQKNKDSNVSSFADRFKGKTSTMDRTGVTGVILNKGTGIQKYNYNVYPE